MLARSRAEGLPAGIKVAIVDYTDVKSLKRALAGRQAVVSALPRTAILSQLALIDAAVATDVKRFIPSEFGANLQNEKSRQLVSYQAKVQVEKYLEERAAQHGITYTYIYTGVLMDWSIRAGILLDFRNAKAVLYDGGNNAVSMNTLLSAAQAILGVLSNYNATANRAVHVHGTVISQIELLSYAKEVAPCLPWTEEIVDLEKLEREAAQQGQVGSKLANMTIFHTGAMKAAFADGYGNRFSGTDNTLLGVQAFSEAGIKELLRTLYEESRRS